MLNITIFQKVCSREVSEVMSPKRCAAYIYLKQQKTVWSLLYLQRMRRNISALQNDE